MQYEIVFSESFLPSDEANDLLQTSASFPSSSEQPTSEIAKHSNSEQQILSQESYTSERLDTYERLLLDSRPYLCRIPFVPPEVESNTTASTQAEQQQELIRASDHGWELLSGMQGTCLYYASGWWVYSYCSGDGVNQFHPMAPGRGYPMYPPTPDPEVFNFRLGSAKKGDTDQNKDVSSFAGSSEGQYQTRGESNYLVEKLGGGTTCDLTGEPRQVEIQYHCNPNFGDKIHMIKETATCSYLMVIHTPRLCNEVAFQPPQTDKPHLITCEEIVSRDEEADWKKGKTAQASFELFQAEEAHRDPETGNPKRLVVGGIQFAAQNLVGGSPERTIKVGKIATPPKPKEEKYIATLASSDGKYTKIMNEQEIRRYDLKGSLEEIADYIEQTEEWAGNMRPGQPWKLDVVQTADGVQYRGILMEIEEEGNQDSKSAEGEDKTKKDGDSEGEPKSEEGSEEEYKQRNEKQP